jgi:hypothetical protein
LTFDTLSRAFARTAGTLHLFSALVQPGRGDDLGFLFGRFGDAQGNREGFCALVEKHAVKIREWWSLYQRGNNFEVLLQWLHGGPPPGKMGVGPCPWRAPYPSWPYLLALESWADVEREMETAMETDRLID